MDGAAVILLAAFAVYVVLVAWTLVFLSAASKPTPAPPSAGSDSLAGVKQASADTLALNNPGSARSA